MKTCCVNHSGLRVQFWCQIYRLKGVWLGIKTMRRMQLGSKARWAAKTWTVYNWSHGPRVSLRRSCGKHERVPIKEIWSIPTPVELYRRYRMMHNWYMGCWHSSEVHHRIIKDKKEA